MDKLTDELSLRASYGNNSLFINSKSGMPLESTSADGVKNYMTSKRGMMTWRKWSSSDIYFLWHGGASMEVLHQSLSLPGCYSIGFVGTWEENIVKKGGTSAYKGYFFKLFKTKVF